MRQDQRFDARFLRDSTDVLRRRVIGPDMRQTASKVTGRPLAISPLMYFSTSGMYMISCTSTSAP
jgi:hypothetical protein